MNLDQLTNKEDYVINTRNTRPADETINLLSTSDDSDRADDSITSDSLAKKPKKKRRKKPKHILYDYRKDPRFKGQFLSIEVPLNPEGGTLISFPELVKKHLDEEEQKQQGDEDEPYEESLSDSEALESGESSSEEAGASVEKPSAQEPFPGEEGIQDEFLQGLLNKARAGEYEPSSDDCIESAGDYDYSDDFIDDTELVDVSTKSSAPKSRPKKRTKLVSKEASECDDENSFDEFGKDPRGISRFFVHHGPLPDTHKSELERPKPKPVSKVSTAQLVPTKAKMSNTAAPSQESRIHPNKSQPITQPKKVRKILKPHVRPQVARPLPTIACNNILISSTSDDSDVSTSSLSTSPDTNNALKISRGPDASTPKRKEDLAVKNNLAAARPALSKSQPKLGEKSAPKEVSPFRQFTSKFTLNSLNPVKKVSEEHSKPINSPSNSAIAQKPQLKRLKVSTPNASLSELSSPWYKNLPVPAGFDVSPDSAEFAARLEDLFKALMYKIREDMQSSGSIPLSVRNITVELIRVHLKFGLVTSGKPPLTFVQRLSQLYNQECVYIVKMISKMFLPDQLAQRKKEKEELVAQFKAYIDKCFSKPDNTAGFKWTSSARKLALRIAQLHSAIFQLTIKKNTSEGKKEEINEDDYNEALYTELNNLLPSGVTVQIQLVILRYMHEFPPLDPDFSVEDFFLKSKRPSSISGPSSSSQGITPNKSPRQAISASRSKSTSGNSETNSLAKLSTTKSSVHKLPSPR